MSWDLSQLNTLLGGHESWSVAAEAECLRVTNENGLEAYVAVSGAQILVECVLFASAQVRDKAALNEVILRTHQVFPLTAVGISTIDDEDYYIAFGALSSQSKEESIEIEVEMLFDNVAGFLEAYEDQLN